MAFRSTLDVTGASSGPWHRGVIRTYILPVRFSLRQTKITLSISTRFSHVDGAPNHHRIKTGRAITIIPCSPLSHITHAQRRGVGAVLVCSFVTTESNRMPVPSQRSTPTGKGSCVETNCVYRQLELKARPPRLLNVILREMVSHLLCTHGFGRHAAPAGLFDGLSARP